MELHTASLWLNSLIFAAGFYILIKGSDLFVDYSAAIARIYRVSEMVIGLTLVSIGTSLPELASSMYAAGCGQSDFVIGNVVGSCTTNITLILGSGIALAGAIHFSPALLKRDGLVMNGIFLVTTAVTFLTSIRLPNGSTSFGVPLWFGLLLLAGTVGYCFFLLRFSDKNAVDEAEEEHEAKPCGAVKAFILALLGLLMVFLGSKMLVDNVVWGAEQLKISTMVISVTIVAFGTSVPELAVTIAGVLKKRHDIAVGNILGSCIFNILMIFGACSLFGPILVDGTTGAVNFAMMCISGFVLLGFMAIGRGVLKRWMGLVLIIGYVAFVIYNCRNIFEGKL